MADNLDDLLIEENQDPNERNRSGFERVERNRGRELSRPGDGDVVFNDKDIFSTDNDHQFSLTGGFGRRRPGGRAAVTSPMVERKEDQFAKTTGAGGKIPDFLNDDKEEKEEKDEFFTKEEPTVKEERDPILGFGRSRVRKYILYYREIEAKVQIQSKKEINLKSVLKTKQKEKKENRLYQRVKTF